MTLRIICPHCPHCHHSVAASSMEIATTTEAQYRICPECDEPIVLFVPTKAPDDALLMAVAPEDCIL